MKIKRGLSWIAILFIVFALVGCSGNKYPEEKIAIEQLARDYFDAAFNIDYQTWTGEEELVYLTAEYADIMKARIPEFKDSFEINTLTQKINHLEIENVTVKSDTDGSASCIVEITGMDNGKQFRQVIHCYLEVKKVNDQWLISDFRVTKVE